MFRSSDRMFSKPGDTIPHAGWCVLRADGALTLENQGHSGDAVTGTTLTL